MENITIESVTDKTAKTGRPYKACEVKDSTGELFKVNIFSTFPDFANLKAGTVILGKLEKNGEYWNLVSATAAPKNNGAYKQKVIEETMAKKNESIGKFQDNKELSIKIASTMNQAVALAIAEYKDKTVLDNLDTAVLKWRRFLWNNWDVDVKDTDAITGNLR